MLLLVSRRRSGTSDSLGSLSIQRKKGIEEKRKKRNIFLLNFEKANADTLESRIHDWNVREEE